MQKLSLKLIERLICLPVTRGDFNSLDKEM